MAKIDIRENRVGPTREGAMARIVEDSYVSVTVMEGLLLIRSVRSEVR